MKSIERAHIAVVASGDQHLVLAGHLCRLQVARASFLSSVSEARAFCLNDNPDLCLAAFNDWAADAAPPAEIDAPGRDAGLPSLLLVGTVTPYMCRLARHCGYFAAVSTTISPRLLYRRMSAALQHRQGAEVTEARVPSAVSAGVRRFAAEMVELRKSTRH